MLEQGGHSSGINAVFTPECVQWLNLSEESIDCKHTSKLWHRVHHTCLESIDYFNMLKSQCILVSTIGGWVEVDWWLERFSSELEA